MKTRKRIGAKSPKGRPFSKGNPGGPGRPKGLPNRIPGEVRAALADLVRDGDPKLKLPPFRERWAKLLGHPDATIRLGAEREALRHLLGNPPQAVTLAPVSQDEEMTVTLKFSEGKPFTSSRPSSSASPDEARALTSPDDFNNPPS